MPFEIPVVQNPGKIEWTDIKTLATSLGVDPHILNAVYLTESAGDGYLPSGKVKILFEGHVFWRNLVKNKIDPYKHLTGNQDILYKTWTKKFYKGGEKEHTRLNRAILIHEASALASASYGAFQVLGENYQDLKYPTVQAFVTEMCSSYTGQLKIFGQFLKFKGIIKHMLAKNWDRIAYLYNGSGYKVNNYDVEMSKNYNLSIRKYGKS